MADPKENMRRPDPSLVKKASGFSSATLHEAMGRRGALPSAIQAIAPGMKLCGPAQTVSSPPMDNLMVHRAIYRAEKGDILVVEVKGFYEAGYWGEIMTHAARQRGIAGLVIDGCIRDRDLISEMGFPVFARGRSIRGTLKNGGGTVNEPIMIGEIRISPGDLVVGDSDGVVVVPQGEIAQTLGASQKREEKEEQIIKQIAAGKSTLEIYGWRS